MPSQRGAISLVGRPPAAEAIQGDEHRVLGAGKVRPSAASFSQPWYDGGMNSFDEAPPVRSLIGSALLGAASGMRSTAGLSAVVRHGDGSGLPPVFKHPLARPAAVIAIAVEVVLDKMPFTGSRLEPPGMAGRLVFAGAAAGLAARQRARPVVPAALVAIVTAAAIAKAAHDVRARLAETVPDRVVAVAEDLVALGTAAAACRC